MRRQGSHEGTTAARRRPGRLARARSPVVSILGVFAALLGGGVAGAAAPPTPAAPPGFAVSVFATAPPTTPATVGADDIARLGDHVFVGWQNGIGTRGEPGPAGQTASTVIEYGPDGRVLASYPLAGKVDGLGGDPLRRRVIATVNEDGNSSLYTIKPSARAGSTVQHYTYAPAPDAAATGGVLTGGGTDAVSVYGTKILLSASNPGTLDATAAFQVRLLAAGHVARLTPTFADDATATDALTGETVRLGLTDPDSNAVVPFSSPSFGGQLAVDGQGDQQIVFARGRTAAVPVGAPLSDLLPGFFEGRLGGGLGGSGGLTRLALTKQGSPAGTDDVRWIGDSGGGTLYVVDTATSTIYAITGLFAPGQALASLDTVGSTAANTEVDRIDLATGELTPFVTGLGKAKGLIWVP